MPCGRAGACRLAALLVLLAMTLALPAAQAHTTDNGPHDSDHTHFYLWRTTITVGEDSGTLGYDKSGAYGSISTGAKFNYPPWSPPPKHHFDPDYQYTVEGLYIFESSGTKFLQLLINDTNVIAANTDPGNVTLWIRNTAFRLKDSAGSPGQASFSSADHDLSVPDLNWSENDKVRVALVYERRLPSEPKNVSVTAPRGEDGTLEVSWEEPDVGGTHPIEYYLVEFRPVGDARRFVRSHVPSSKTSVRRTDLKTGTEYRVLVQALSGDGYGDPETRTVATRAPGNPQALLGITQGPVEPLTEGPVEPLTMRLKGIPNEHDGENHPFVLRMVFSEPVTATEQEMRDHAIEVRGGAVTDARTVGEEDNVWEIEVTPGSDAELSIAVPRVLGCEEEGALCTSDGRELSNGMGVIVAGPSPPPLTAWFEKVPSGHDGERRFKLRVAFSEGIRIGYRTFRDYSVAVKGGHVTRAKRVNRRRDLWEVTVEPDSYGDVTVMLVPGRECGTTGAVCTGDGRELSNGIKRVIQGPGGK